ncbi:MAG: GtrA family protein, partial [Ferruginibacter sp.]|nr:GtrA family protein [Ferruginibacter sp.]
TYRYAVCGFSNTLLGLSLYYIGYHYIFNKQIFSLGFFSVKPHIAAMLVSGSVTFFVGFLLNRYVVFSDSYLRGRVQLFRYFLSFFFNLLLNYALLNFLVDALHVEAFTSQIITTIVIIGVSYITQKYFTFRTKSN